MRTLGQKMGLRSGTRACFVAAPEGILARMALPTLDIAGRLDGQFEHLHLFSIKACHLDANFPIVKPHLAPNGKLWVSWPKSGRLGTDLNIREVIRIGYNHGLVESTCLSVDDTWSALKFTHPVPGRTYHNSYGKLPGQ